MENSIKLSAQAFICYEGNFDNNCAPERIDKELLFLFNKSSNTVTLNIDNNQAYILNAEIVGKILELIHDKPE